MTAGVNFFSISFEIWGLSGRFGGVVVCNPVVGVLLGRAFLKSFSATVLVSCDSVLFELNLDATTAGRGGTFLEMLVAVSAEAGLFPVEVTELCLA